LLRVKRRDIVLITIDKESEELGITYQEHGIDRTGQNSNMQWLHLMSSPRRVRVLARRVRRDRPRTTSLLAAATPLSSHGPYMLFQTSTKVFPTHAAPNITD
jgi:hypothetical protein